MFCESRDKPRIDYPCLWEYRLVGANADELRSAVRDTIGDRQHSLGPGNRKGRWLSLSLKLTVDSEAERDALHRQLNAHAAVRMVF